MAVRGEFAAALGAGDGQRLLKLFGQVENEVEEHDLAVRAVTDAILGSNWPRLRLETAEKAEHLFGLVGGDAVRLCPAGSREQAGSSCLRVG